MEGQDFLLVAETDNKLIGYISAQKGRLNRIAHSAYIVIGILTDYRNKGIGTEFFKRLPLHPWIVFYTSFSYPLLANSHLILHIYYGKGKIITVCKEIRVHSGCYNL